jgi:hypothetical protein
MHRPAVRSKVEIAEDGRLVSLNAPPFGNGPLAAQFQLKTVAARMKTTTLFNNSIVNNQSAPPPGGV